MATKEAAELLISSATPFQTRISWLSLSETSTPGLGPWCKLILSKDGVATRKAQSQSWQGNVTGCYVNATHDFFFFFRGSYREIASIFKEVQHRSISLYAQSNEGTIDAHRFRKPVQIIWLRDTLRETPPYAGIQLHVKAEEITSVLLIAPGILLGATHISSLDRVSSSLKTCPSFARTDRARCSTIRDVETVTKKWTLLLLGVRKETNWILGIQKKRESSLSPLRG